MSESGDGELGKGEVCVRESGTAGRIEWNRNEWIVSDGLKIWKHRTRRGCGWTMTCG